MIIYYTYTPYPIVALPNRPKSHDDDSEKKLKPFTLHDHLPNEHIVMAIAAGNSKPTIRLLFSSGRVWRSVDLLDDQFPDILSGRFLEEFGLENGLIVTSIDCFMYTSLYLVKNLKRGGKTVLYGEGKNHYKSLGNEDGEGVRAIFDPHEEITHIACCFSFSCCVLNKRDIRVCGQDWISSKNGDLKWDRSQFMTKEDIVDFKGGNFHLVAYLKDHRCLVAGSSNYGQTFSPNNPESFTYVTLDLPIRSLSCSSSRTLVEFLDNTFRIYGNGCNSENPNVELPVPFEGSTDIESVLLFRDPLIYIPKNHPNILIYHSANTCQNYDISDYFPNQNYRTVGILGHTKCLLLYPKQNQLAKFLSNLQISVQFGHFSDISLFPFCNF